MTEKHYWWKILGVILMLYVLTHGLLTPLKHGIVGLNPDRVHAGTEVKFRINSYNANYTVHGNKIEAYLKHIPERGVNPQEEKDK